MINQLFDSVDPRGPHKSMSGTVGRKRRTREEIRGRIIPRAIWKWDAAEEMDGSSEGGGQGNKQTNCVKR